MTSIHGLLDILPSILFFMKICKKNDLSNSQDNNPIFFYSLFLSQLPQHTRRASSWRRKWFASRAETPFGSTGFHALPEDHKAPIGEVEFEEVRGPHGMI